jgi:excisionase family DNA binding protein
MKKKKEVASTAVPVEGRLLTTEDVADRLGVGTITVKRMVRRGELSVLRIGHNTPRFTEAALQAFLQSKQSKAA